MAASANITTVFLDDTPPAQPQSPGVAPILSSSVCLLSRHVPTVLLSPREYMCNQTVSQPTAGTAGWRAPAPKFMLAPSSEGLNGSEESIEDVNPLAALLGYRYTQRAQ